RPTHIISPTPGIPNLMSRSASGGGFAVVLFALGLLWISPLAQAQDFNTAFGDFALSNLTTGDGNSAFGYSALFKNTSGNNNTASGAGALSQLTIGSFNAADGSGALSKVTTGSSNIGVGYNAGLNLTTGSNNIDIGNLGVAGDTNTIRIGKPGTQT